LDDRKIVSPGDGSASCARQTWRRVKNRLSQLPRLPPGRVDAALAAIVVLAGAVELALIGDTSAIGAFPIVLLVAACLMIRRERPLDALFLGIGAYVVSGLGPEEVANQSVAAFVTLMFLVFNMAARTDPPVLYVAIGVSLVGGSVSFLLDPFPDTVSEYLSVVALLVAAPVAGGRLVRSRTALTHALREKAEQGERDRARRAEEAVGAERTRIANELHDVVAHALGAMTVQAAAARRLTEKKPERAAGAFQAVEETGREALTELRRLLGVLRHEDADLALAPQPRLAFLADLARRATAGGLHVQLDVEGTAGAIPASIDLVAYRVVQEALNEAYRSGGAGNAIVHVRHRHGEVEVEVLDDGHLSDRRLLGMRERVRVYGGQLEVAPRREGGHRVRARLPLERAA
jgi:signal transduction histidine kinase